MLVPVQVKRETEFSEDLAIEIGRGLTIRWSTSEVSFIPSKTLRSACPCASCEHKRGDESHLKPLNRKSSKLQIITSTLSEETNLIEIWPVGNYALGCRWQDKHDSGIYTYSLLRSLGQELNK